MRTLTGSEEKEALEWLLKAAEIAKFSATCQRRKCGSIIVAYDIELGSGFNGPPGNIESQRRCQCDKNAYHQKVTDKTCCVHAEHRAICDALRRAPVPLPGSRLYFASVDDQGVMLPSGEPYCTSCSKFALDEQVKEFTLMHSHGIVVYDTEEYNDLSYKFNGPGRI